jgi:hypothetical protein
MEKSVDLLIFTVAGRAHLLIEAWSTFKDHCDLNFNRVILSIAGMDEKYFPVLETIKPDTCLWDWNIPGYYASAVRAITESTADYYFWLEDDYTFHRDIPAELILSVLKEQKDVVQIAIPQGGGGATEGVSIIDVDWMVGTVPHFGNGMLMREKFATADPAKICKEGESIGIESYLGRCFQGYKRGHLGTKNGRFMTHIGAMYASDRELVSVTTSESSEGARNLREEGGKKLSEYGNKRSRKNKYQKQISITIRHLLKFAVLFFRVIVAYPFSKKAREFVARALQYDRNTIW